MNIKRIQELYEYNPSKGLLKEWGDVDTSGWICVGEVSYDPWLKGIDKLYVMVNPQKQMKWGEYVNDVRYTQNPDGSGSQVDTIPVYAERQIEVYPEHYDDEYGEIFLGKKKDKETLERLHNDFYSKLFKIGDKVIIHHFSNYVLKDGFIKKGKQNNWSNNSDIGIYFWGSRNCGRDISNEAQYIYYCIIPMNEIYDFSTNEERIMSLDRALRKYPYVGQFWKKSEAIVISTFQETPIWCVVDKQTGNWYNKDWEKIEKPF